MRGGEERGEGERGKWEREKGGEIYSTRQKKLSIPSCLTTVDIVWSRPLCDRCRTVAGPLCDRCMTVV